MRGRTDGDQIVERPAALSSVTAWPPRELVICRLAARRSTCRGHHEPDPERQTKRPWAVPLLEGRTGAITHSACKSTRGTAAAPLEAPSTTVRLNG